MPVKITVMQRSRKLAIHEIADILKMCINVAKPAVIRE